MKIATSNPQGKLFLWIIIIGLSFCYNSKILHAQITTKVANQGTSVDNLSEDPEKDFIKSGNDKKNSSPKNPFESTSILFATIFVLILILVIAWIVKKINPAAGMLFGSLPCLQIIGRANLGPKQTLALVKLDSRLILLGVTDHQINQVLTITDPDEVSRLTSLIAKSRPSAFKNLFSKEEKNISLEQQNPDDLDDAEKFSHKNEENEVLQLQNELNLLIHKVEKLKGIGGRNSSE